jgi:hypothetical protein
MPGWRFFRQHEHTTQGQDSMSKKLGTIKQELAACRKAWAKNPDAQWAWCCHHSVLMEEVNGRKRAEERIRYILTDKNKAEQAARFRNFRPVTAGMQARIQANRAQDMINKAEAELDKAEAELDKDSPRNWGCRKLLIMHKLEWPDNTWNKRKRSIEY